MTGPDMENVVANVLNLLDAANDDADDAVPDVARVVVLMIRILARC
jgi:hypothetical protein